MGVAQKADFCVAVIEHFAFDKNKKEAVFSYRKFAKIGINTWIQEINQWKPVEKTLTSTEALLIQVQKMVEVERQLTAVKEDVKFQEFMIGAHHEWLKKHDHELTGVKAELHRFGNGTGDYYTILAWSRIIECKPLTLRQAQTLGRRATKLCKAQSLETGITRDPRFGEVKTYPECVLGEIDFNLAA